MSHQIHAHKTTGREWNANSRNEKPAAEPIIIAVGSHTRVQIHHMFDKIASLIRRGIGLKWSIFVTIIVIGAISMIVLTLSNTIDNIAVRAPREIRSFQ